MLRTITVAGVLACGAMLTGCAADTTPLDTAERGPATTEPTEAAQQTFQVWLLGDMPPETAVSAILEAGQVQLAKACAATPDASIRIMNPLASGSFEDVPCASILSGEESTVETSAALSSAEHIWQVQQKGIITTVACFAGGAASFLVPRYGICPHGRTEQDRTTCNDIGGWGGLGIGFLCALTAVIPF